MNLRAESPEYLEGEIGSPQLTSYGSERLADYIITAPGRALV